MPLQLQTPLRRTKLPTPGPVRSSWLRPDHLFMTLFPSIIYSTVFRKVSVHLVYVLNTGRFAGEIWLPIQRHARSLLHLCEWRLGAPSLVDIILTVFYFLTLSAMSICPAYFLMSHLFIAKLSLKTPDLHDATITCPFQPSHIQRILVFSQFPVTSK